MITVQLLDGYGQVLADGQPDDHGHVRLRGDDSRPPLGGYPRIRIIHEEPA